MPAKTAKELQALLDDFDWEAWNKDLEPGFTQIYRDLVMATGKKTAREYGDDVTFDAKDPFVSEQITDYIGDRITQLSETTKDDVSDALVRAFDNAEEGLSADSLRDLILDTVREKYDGYESWRALQIGRTESAIGFNTGTVFGGKQAGFDNFEVTDGTDDEECAAANGAVWTAAECLEDPVAHPSCTRIFTPTEAQADSETQGAEADAEEA